jgi:uncharacterized repeat protein (TIGR03809 family)
MTHPTETRGRDIVARWCILAEQRLEYLTELFETGRWRRYHSELAFLENIQEAKCAVEIWRGLSTREAPRNNSAVNIPWLGRVRATPARSEGWREHAHRLQPQSAQLAAEPPPHPVSIPDQAERDLATENNPQPLLDVATIQERYPVLRNAL